MDEKPVVVAEQQEIFVSVCIPVTEREYRQLFKDSCRLESGQVWQAVRERMGLPGKPFRWVTSERRGNRLVVSQNWWRLKHRDG